MQRQDRVHVARPRYRHHLAHHSYDNRLGCLRMEYISSIKFYAAYRKTDLNNTHKSFSVGSAVTKVPMDPTERLPLLYYFLEQLAI